MRLLLALTGEPVAPQGFQPTTSDEVRGKALQAHAFHQLPTRGKPEEGVTIERCLRFAFDSNVIDHFEPAVTPAPGDIEILGYHNPFTTTTLFFMRRH